MPTYTTHEVVIYHDETAFENGTIKGHVLLFVPVRIAGTSTTPLFGAHHFQYDPHELLFNEVIHLREYYKIDKKLHFTDITGTKWGKFDLGTRAIILTVIDALRHKSSDCFKRPLACKLGILFYPKDADYSLYGTIPKGEQKLRHHETMLRILLKGTAHHLYNDFDRVVIHKIISDGQPYRRPLSEDRVIWRITMDELHGKAPLRDYVTFAPSTQIVHLQSDHKLYKPDTAQYISANLLQVSDLLLGSAIRSCYVGSTNWPSPPRLGTEHIPKKDVISYPLKEMLDKVNRKGGFQDSGHYRSFTLNEVEFSKGGVNFKPVTPKPMPTNDPNTSQPRLPINDFL